MRSTLLKTALAAAVGLSVASCTDSLAPTEGDAPALESAIPVSGQAAPRFPLKRLDGTWSGTLTINPGTWKWQLEQDGNTVTGVTTPAPAFAGTITGTLDGNVLSVLIQYPNGASNYGDLTFENPGNFSGVLTNRLASGFEFDFSTDMRRGGRPVGGAAATLSATAAASGDASDDLASMYNADGTPVNRPGSN